MRAQAALLAVRRMIDGIAGIERAETKFILAIHARRS